ncbi:MAG: OsmC family protein [Anaerolineae bacterium]|nr:OsmC family protein [Anaerolineae bacterium]
MGTVSVKWITSQLMTGVDSFGHPITIGSWPEKEPQWAGLKPSDLLMLAAASCTGYDVVMILTKQKEPLEDLEVICTGEQQSEPPYAFTTMHINYVFKGQLNPKKVERAIKLSEEKYCSVTNTLRKAVTITSSYEIIDESLQQAL